MGIRIVDASETMKGSGKFETLAIDLLEIINNRIEYCELTDFPYSEKTSIGSILSDSKRVFVSEFWKLTNKRIKREEVPFVMKRTKDADGKTHVYARFAVNTWDAMIRRAKEEK